MDVPPHKIPTDRFERIPTDLHVALAIELHRACHHDVQEVRLGMMRMRDQVLLDGFAEVGGVRVVVDGTVPFGEVHVRCGVERELSRGRTDASGCLSVILPGETATRVLGLADDYRHADGATTIGDMS